MVYMRRGAAVSHGTSLINNSAVNTSVNLQNVLCKPTITHSELDTTKVYLVHLELERDDSTIFAIL